MCKLCDAEFSRLVEECILFIVFFLEGIAWLEWMSTSLYLRELLVHSHLVHQCKW